MRTTAIEELDVPIPDYVDRFLDVLAQNTGMTKEDIALFFLLQGAEYASCPDTMPQGEAP